MSLLLLLIMFLIALPSGAQEVVVLYADSGPGPLNSGIQGFMHGMDEQGNLEPSAVETLSPGNWRLSKIVTYNLARQFPVSITYVLSDSYAWSQGGYPNAKPWQDWKAYEDYIRTKVQYIYLHFADNPPEFFDVWNEPDLGYFWSGSYSQLLELYSRCAAVVWSVNPDAKLVGPSIARYDENGSGVENIVQFLADLDTEYGLRMDAVSWHENESGILGSDRPELIPENARSIRSKLLEVFGPDYMPELHVNEYSGRYVHLSPGYNAGYLHYLLEAEIDCASRAAWTVRSLYDPPYGYWSDCWSGLDGMFNWDGHTPQVIYWVYEFFGRMLEKERLLTELPNPSTVAEAVRDDSDETVMVMVGRYYHGDQSTDLTLHVQDWPFEYDRVRVVAKRVPHYPGFFNTTCPITVAMPEGPTDSLFMEIDVTGGVFDVSIENFRDNDVWLFTLSEATPSSIHSDCAIDFDLSAAPNPFGSSTTLHFALNSAGHVRLTIHDISGRLIAVLSDGYKQAGDHSCIWEGRDDAGRMMATGVYLARLETDTGVLSQSLAHIQ